MRTTLTLTPLRSLSFVEEAHLSFVSFVERMPRNMRGLFLVVRRDVIFFFSCRILLLVVASRLDFLAWLGREGILGDEHEGQSGKGKVVGCTSDVV